MNAALEAAFGAPVILLCDDEVVYEIYYGFYTQGPVNNATFIPTSNTGSTSNCPATVQYPPK